MSQMESVLRWVRSCPRCASFLPPIDGFCLDCMAEVVSHSSQEFLFTTSMPFPTMSLLKWHRGEDVGLLIKSLKGPWSKGAYRILAQEFLKRKKWVGRESLILVPPSKNGKPDHAMSFAEALGEILGWKVCSPFRFIRPVEQKSLSREERLQLRFDLVFRPKAEAFIFVDDLITTGATAKAAWKALGKPDGFSAWTVACRPMEKLL